MAPPGTTPTSGTQCISDSVTHYNLLDDPIAHVRPPRATASRYGVHVSGGNDAVRYFASGDAEQRDRPDPDAGLRGRSASTRSTSRCATSGSTRSRSSRSTSAANLSASLSPKFDLTANAGFSKLDNRIEPESDLIIALYYVGMQNYGYKGARASTSPAARQVHADGTAVPLND